jgi:hypothetical protein
MSTKLFLRAIAFAATALCATAARANIVFDWTGTCLFNCKGTPSAVLTLTDAYVFGTTISAADFVSLVYNSNDQSKDITSTSLLTGGVNADGSIALGVLNIRGPLNFPQFSETDEEDWQLMPNATTTTPDLGTDGKFTLAVNTAIPEPSTWAMVLLGFAGLGFASYLRRTARPSVVCVASAIGYVSWGLLTRPVPRDKLGPL